MTYHSISLLIASLFIAAVSLLLVANIARGKEVKPLPVAEATKLATTPADRNDERWWRNRHTATLAKKQQRLERGDEINLVFVGDSITQGWENKGRQLWKQRFAPYGALNLGFSGDRTEHVLWRLGFESDGAENDEHNQVRGLAPKLFVVMIGSNNTGHRLDPAAATAAGVTQIIKRLREESPDSHVLLLGVFPRSEKPDDKRRRLNAEINKLIAPLGKQPGVTFLDIGKVFLDDDGTLPKSVMPDGLHPNAEGYQRWADALREPLAEHLGPLPTAETPAASQ